MSLRTRDASFFQNPDCSWAAAFGYYLHYKDDSGSWQNVDLNLYPQGSDYVANHHDVIVRVTGAAIEATERSTGRGIRWITTGPPAVAGRKATYADRGLLWQYSTRISGIKLDTIVAARKGPQTYDFVYQLLGGARDLTVDSGGNLVSDAFTIPRAVAYGADDELYQAGPWQLLQGNRVAFTFDDSSLPAAAFPYDLDPKTAFYVATSGDDGRVWGTSTGYPPGATTAVTDVTYLRAARTYSPTGNNYHVSVALARWDTSALPDDAHIQTAALLPYVNSYTDQDGRFLTADWYTAWPIDLADYSSSAQTSALASYPLESLGTGNIDMDNTDGVSTTGYTGLRVHISGGQPGGTNEVNFASYDDTSHGGPLLWIFFESSTFGTACNGVGDVTWPGMGGGCRYYIAQATTAVGNQCWVAGWLAGGCWYWTSVAPYYPVTAVCDEFGFNGYQNIQGPCVFWTDTAENAVVPVDEISGGELILYGNGAANQPDPELLRFDLFSCYPIGYPLTPLTPPCDPEGDGAEAAGFALTDANSQSSGDGCRTQVETGPRGELVTVHYGTDASDTCYGGPGEDIFWMRSLDDVAYGDGGSDFIHLGSGADDGYGEGGNDALYGGQDTDTMYGGDDEDWFYDTCCLTKGSARDYDLAFGGRGVDHADFRDGDYVDYFCTGGPSDFHCGDTESYSYYHNTTIGENGAEFDDCDRDACHRGPYGQ